MGTAFLRVFTVSAAVSLLLLPLLVCRGWIEKTYSPKTRWGLWLAVALVLLVAPWVPKSQAPVVVEAPAYTVTLPALPAQKPQTPAAPNIQPAPPVGEQAQPVVPANEQPKGEVPAQAESQGQVNAQPAASGIPQTAQPRRSTVELTTLLGAVWLTVAALILLGQGGGYLLARRRLLRGAEPVTRLERYAAELGLEGRVTFYHCEAVPGPMTLGMWRPAVLLPSEGLAVAALRHELYHVKRRDVAYKVLLLCACALHWFNPLVWLMYRAADRDVEACCDAAVVEGQDSGYRRSYGELLLTAAAGPRVLPFTTSFGGGAEQMKARLTQLFHPGKRSRALVCGVLALAVALGSLVACGQTEQTKPEPLEDGLYCVFDDDVYGSYPAGEDYGSIRLPLLHYSEEEGPGGGPLGVHTLSLSANLTLREDGFDPGEKGTERWQQAVASFLMWPMRRSYIPLGSDYLILEVKDSEVIRMFWILVYENDRLYTNEAYGFSLLLPESWAGNYTVEEDSGEIRFLYQEDRQPIMILHVTEENSDQEGWALIAAYDRCVYWEFPGEAEGPIQRLREDIQKQDTLQFTWLAVAGIGVGGLLTEKTMPTVDYYDSQRGFLLYHTLDTVYFWYEDGWDYMEADHTAGRRVIWRCDVSEDEQTVYLSDVFDDFENRDERFYAWDIGTRTLRQMDSIPDGVDHMNHVGREELFYSGFQNGSTLMSNVIRAKDGTLVGLYIDQRLENAMEYLQLARLKDGYWVGGDVFLTPELIRAPRIYAEPTWGFSLTLPESLEGNYIVLHSANDWSFYDKELYPLGGYLFSLRAEETVTQQNAIDRYPGQWPGKVLGERDGITYTFTGWPADYLSPAEWEDETYMTMFRDVWNMDGTDLDLTFVSRSSSYLWPLPYIDYGSEVIFGEDNNTLRIQAPEGVTVQSITGGKVVSVTNAPSAHMEEKTVVVAHPDGRYSVYGHLGYVEVKEGDEVERGGIIGIARAEENRRSWLTFRLMEGSSWESATAIDPWSVEYRTYDFLPLTRDDMTIAGDPRVTEALRDVLYGRASFYDVETREYRFANALGMSDGQPVAVYRFAQVDMDNDTIPEIVLWLQRGDDIYQLGSIVLRYQSGEVYGYSMGYRSMDPISLKVDGTFNWSSGAANWGFGRINFKGGGEKYTYCQGVTYFVKNAPATREEFYVAYNEENAKEDVIWYEMTEENIVRIY